MRAKTYFVASSSAEKGTISLMTTTERNHITFIGTSLNTGAQPGDRLHTLVLGVPKDTTGLVAVIIQRCGKDSFSVGFFLSVGWKDGKPWIDLEDAWMPTGDRLAQLVAINAGGAVRVQIGDVWYTSSDSEYEPIPMYVADHNLLCRYLIGKAEAAEVEAATVKLSKEASLYQQLEAIKGQLSSSHDALNDSTDEKKAWKSAATSLRTAVQDTLTFKRKAIELAITNFPVE